MTTNTVSVEHGILFVFDPECPEFDVPEYNATEPIACNAHCVSVSVRPSVDGEVEVSIGRTNDYRNEATVVFEGTIATPQGRVAVVTAANQVVVSVSHGNELAELVVRVDTPFHAAKVWVEVT